MPAKTRTTHGLAAMKRAIRARGLRGIDGRCVAMRAVSSWRAELAEALGGEDSLTPQRRALCDACARTQLFLDVLDAWLVQQKSLVNGRKRSIIPALVQREQLVGSLLRTLGALGLDRQQRPVKSLREYIEEHDRDEEHESRSAAESTESE